MEGPRGVNWAGLAALITAIGGIIGLFYNQHSSDSKQTMTMESMYAVLEYRLSIVEKVCGAPTPNVTSPRPRTRRTPSFESIQKHITATGRPLVRGEDFDIPIGEKNE